MEYQIHKKILLITMLRENAYKQVNIIFSMSEVNAKE